MNGGSFLKSSSFSEYGSSVSGSLNKNKSTSMLSLFSTKSHTAKKTAKKLQSQTSNGYGSYSNLFSAASYGSMCSLDKKGKKKYKKNKL